MAAAPRCRNPEPDTADRAWARQERRRHVRLSDDAGESMRSHHRNHVDGQLRPVVPVGEGPGSDGHLLRRHGAADRHRSREQARRRDQRPRRRPTGAGDRRAEHVLLAGAHERRHPR